MDVTPSIRQTSVITLWHATYRSFQMTLLWLVVLRVGKKRSKLWCGVNHLQINGTNWLQKEKGSILTFFCSCQWCGDSGLLSVPGDPHWWQTCLEWTENNKEIYRKCQSWLYCLRRIRSFDVCRCLTCSVSLLLLVLCVLGHWNLSWGY